MQIPETSQHDLQRIWKPQALLMAENGKGETTIVLFLKSKGIFETNAKAIASEIVSQGKRNNKRLHLPLQVFGWLFVVMGVSVPLAILLFGRGFHVITLAPLALGSAMVWGGYGRGTD